MDKKKKQKTENLKKTKKINKKIVGLDIDKMEYQQIVLSQSNHPERNYFRYD